MDCIDKQSCLNQENQPKQNQSKDNEEINLIDYLKVVSKRKWLILIMGLGSAIIVGFLSFFVLPKIYQIDSSFKIGKINNETIESPVQLAGEINSGIYRNLIREKLKISEDEYLKIKATNPKSTDLIILEIESSQPELAKSILEEIANIVLFEQQKQIIISRELIENDIKIIKEKIQRQEQNQKQNIEKIRIIIKLTENEIVRLTNKIDYTEKEEKRLEAEITILEKLLTNGSDINIYLALFSANGKLAGKKKEIENLFIDINRARKQLINISTSVSEEKIADFMIQINNLKASFDNFEAVEIVKNPTVSKNPIKPKPIFNIVIAGVLGIFIGTFLAFSKEWWQKNRT